MKVLSLFDGISCGQIALERAGIDYDTYYASEIDKFAIKVTQNNYPNTIQLGDVRDICPEQLPKIDLLLGGFPCQSFSFAGKGLNFNDPRGQLFFELDRIRKAIKPTYFLFENVVMKKAHSDIISQYLGVESIQINSSLVSAQNRKRLYWSNIPHISPPKDRGIKLHSILNNPLNAARIVGRRLNSQGKREDSNKNIPLTQYLEVRPMSDDKCGCLTTVEKDNVLTSLPFGRHPDVYGRKLPYRFYDVDELCRLQTIPENYFDNLNLSRHRIGKLVGNAWTVDIISHILSHIP